MHRFLAPAVAALVLALAGAWVFSPALGGSRDLSANAIIFHSPPFAAHPRPPAAAPENPYLFDLAYLYGPQLRFARDAVRDGRLPAWNPYVGAGRPLGAQQAAPFFPTTWPAFVLSSAERATVFVFLAKLLLAGLGMFLFARRLGLRGAAALVGALAYALGNPFLVFLGHAQTNVFALLPWMLLAAHAAAERRRVRDGLLLGLVGGVTLYGGHPESYFVAAACAAAYAAFVRMPVRLWLVAGATAALVGALSLLPFAELADQAVRLDRGGGGPDSLRQLGAGLAFPELWGRPDKHVFNATSFATPSSLYPGRAYLGALPLLLAAAGLTVRRTATQWFFAALGAVSVLVLLDTPLRAGLRHLPLFSIIQLHELVWPLALALAVLAAFGLDRALTASPAERRRILIAGTAVAAVAVLACLATRPALRHSLGAALGQFPTLRPGTGAADTAALGAVLRFAALAGLGLALVAAARGPRARAVLAAGAVALTAADLATLGRGYFPAVEPSVAAPPLPPAVARATGARRDQRLAGLDGAFLPGLAVAHRRLDARGHDLPELERYTRLWTALGGVAEQAQGLSITGTGTPVRGRLLSVFAARYVLDGGGPAPPGPPVRTLYAEPGARLLENPDALPRAWFADGRRGAASLDPALAAVRRSDVAALRRAPVIEGVEGSSAGTPNPGTATITRSDDTAVDVAVAARRPGHLVLADTFYPGWEAEVDGRAAPLRAADAAFRAVPVPAGRHVVAFRYRSPVLAWGGRLALAGLALVALGVAAGIVRDRRRRPG